ncbi:MAG: formylmethanofuran dehydrogenase subunit A [Candidatus Syntrophoarchaeum sp.]|nr:formylmethanofuran dehydrogenase subunit A [Methanomicrobia archaeon]MBL7117909.1 formylmethanofuran dehydrogenase subunit A [Candidatus Syntrophoarchaeum sp.]
MAEGELLIKNGVVYDPINGVNGEKKDICIRDGKVVEEVKNPKVIDAGGRVVMPGGVDIHSHIAGGKVNSGRLFRPEDGRRGLEAKTKVCRMQSGYSVPNTFATGYRYAKMGYTFVMEAAMPPLAARHTHEEIVDIPILDNAALPLIDNNWMTLDYVKSGDIDLLTAYIAWIIKATKGYGVKIVNPGGTEAWAWGKNCDLNDTVPYFDVTPAEIVKSLGEANEKFEMPHSIHVHTNMLGHPGNFGVTMATYDLVKGIKPSKDRQVLHATHTQFHSYGGTNWGDFESKADAIADYVNKNEHVTIDIGSIILGDTTTMTADGPMEYSLYQITGRKWTNHDVELETGSGITPFLYSGKSPVNTIQWAIGQELALLVKDPWKVALTTDHPNAGPFIGYPILISMLMSKKRREESAADMHSAIYDRAALPSIDREYDLYEIAIITRGMTAKALGLHEHGKGHLGVGADGDVAIYDMSPEERDAGKIQKAFLNTKYTIKGGEIVVKDGEVVATPAGKTYFVTPECDDTLTEEMLKKLKDKFEHYYSVTFNNYPVQDAYVPNPYEIKAPMRG